MRILAFGDSITYGAWDTQAGWVERLKRDAHRQTVQSEGTYKLQVINLGIGGDTSTGILRRMPAEIAARYSASWPFVFIFMFGTNDERSIDGQIETPIEQFKANCQEIIHIAKEHTDRILIVGPPPLGKPLLSFKGQEYSDERIQAYEEQLETAATSAGLPFVPLRPAFERAGAEDLFSYDSLHPNDAGHLLIASTIQDALDKLFTRTDTKASLL